MKKPKPKPKPPVDGPGGPTDTPPKNPGDKI